MKFLSQTSLRRKLILVIMLSVGMALLLALSAFVLLERREFRASAHRELYTLAELLAENSWAALEFQIKHEADHSLSNLRTQRRIVESAILDLKHEPFATYHRDGSRQLKLPTRLPEGGSAFEGSSLWLTRPVRNLQSGEHIGTVYLRADMSELDQRLRWVLLGGVLFTLGIGAVAALLAARAGRVISGPILHLAAAAQAISEGRNRDLRVPRETEDEVGTLVDAFNAMLDQLGDRQARLEEAQRLARLGNWSFDPRRRRFDFSEEALRIFGVDPSRVVLDFEAIQALVHPEELPLLQALFLGEHGDDDAFAFDHRLIQPDGTVRWVHLTGAVFIQEGGQDRLLRGTLMDITERKHAEAAMLQGQKLESLGVLAGGIAHDFNNLLAALQGNLDLAQEMLPETSPARPYLQMGDKIIHKAADLTRQMLAYSGKGQFRRVPMDVSRLVKEMGHLLSVSISKKAELRYEVAEQLPPIVGDPAQIQQVVMNLVINASDALKERGGYILVRTREEHLLETDLQSVYSGQELIPGTYVVLEVQDNGHGMDAHTMARIFDPFFTTKFQGRGLGLAAMLGIVKGHKGGIKVYSEPGKGTSFELLFPASEQTPEVSTQEPAGGEFRGSGLVLVVDDEPDIRDAAAGMLQHLGFEVVLAANGSEGLARFRELHAQLRLVILDLTMPQMDGAECLRALRQVSTAVPVLLSSGFSERESMESLESLSPAGFLQKPYTYNALKARLKAVLT